MIKPGKIDPWGGGGGRSRDVQVAPYRLLSLTVRSGDTIDAISFSYIGDDGYAHHEGPWGGNGGDEHQIHLGLMDYVKEISGTTAIYFSGMATRYVSITSVVRTLKIVTFRRTYGPYGTTDKSATPFCYPVLGSDRITGFYGRSGSYLDSIGIYVRRQC